MTIIELIKHEHDEVADLFDHLVVLARDHRRTSEVTRLAARLVSASRVHARAEERVFYEALRGKPALKAFALAGPHEHEVLDTTLDKLLVRRPGPRWRVRDLRPDPGADEYQVIVTVARDLFDMHARDEEEADILPIVQELLSAEELAALAEDMRAEEIRIRPQILRQVGMPARAA